MASSPTTFEVVYDGCIGGEIRSEIVKELVKYILYQRSQIPMYFDQIKDALNRELTGGLNAIQPVGTGRNKSTENQTRLVRSVEALFETIENVFVHGTVVKQVLIVLGSNIISPKDSYLITFPTECYDGKMLSRQTCVSLLFRTLYSRDFLSYAKLMTTCTNLFVLFSTTRSCDHTKLKLTPRLSYKVPTVGTCYTVSIVFKGKHVHQINSELNLTGGSSLDISGVQPLDSQDSCDLVVNNLSAENATGVTLEHDEYIWFEAPISVKGYRESACKM